MNFALSKSTSSATKPKPKPVIRKTTVQVPIPATGKPPARAHDPNRWKPSQPASSSSSSKPTNPAKRALSAARGTKRKKSVTPQRPAFSSDDEDDNASSDIGASDSDVSRKRIKSSVSSVGSNAPRRNVRSALAFEDTAVIDIVHGADATSGEYARKYKNPWSDEDFKSTELQYPSKSQRERFELKLPKNEAEDYKPVEDITETIKIICLRYFPEELAVKYTHDENGYERRFNRAWQRQSISEILEIVQDFNTTLTELLSSGTIERELDKTRALDLEWVIRILTQIYARTVSPKVETLRAYQNGSDNVYGELLPRFCSDIFQKTRLNHEQVFIDLGSGVGNVVLQAALEIGCESWGIEMMPNPCDLADLQAKEFPARARLWGLNPGTVTLLRGDFLTNTAIHAVLRRADVVLVNNQAFTPGLNDNLRNLLLELKDGCQVVSLKPFVPEGWKMQVRNMEHVANSFTQRRFEYFSDYVSWGAQSGNWYIAEKDPRPLEAFKKRINGRR